MYPNLSGSLVHLPKPYKILVSSPPSYPLVDPDFADELFQKLSAEKPLFNGTLLCVNKTQSHQMSVYPLSFKDYIASHHQEDYFYHHAPLAVSGWIHYNGAILMGIRSDDVYFHPGYLELVPSGGVDAHAIEPSGEVHYERALIKEFEEETGLPKSCIKKLQVEALYQCPEKRIFDICLSIDLKSDPTTKIELSSDEYTHLFWLPIHHLEDFIEKNRSKILPLSLLLLKEKILLKGSYE